MRILETHYEEAPSAIHVQGEMVQVRSFQIIVWCRISDSHRNFPVVVDTGHTHNFSISEDHLKRWAGIEPGSLKTVGHIWLGRQRLLQLGTNVFLHGEATYRLEMDRGITLFREGDQQIPRLPLLGLRAITRNKLRLVVDGERRSITLEATVEASFPGSG